MGGGFKLATNSATTPPFAGARTSPDPCYCSDNHSIFGPVPSCLEVESAILQLRSFIRCLSTTLHGQIYNPHLQSSGFTKFAEAFAMMQAEAPLKELVTSICCDKAVWEAILKNEAIHDLQGSIFIGKNGRLVNAAAEEKKASYGDEFPQHILTWILGFSKSKILQLVDKFVSLLNHLFHTNPTSEPNHQLDEKINSSFLLSLVILIIVVFARGHD